MQDASLQESTGPIVDRSRENLVSTDNGIILARNHLLAALKALTEQGAVPPGVDPTHHHVRSAVILPDAKAFLPAAAEALTARLEMPHASV